MDKGEINPIILDSFQSFNIVHVFLQSVFDILLVSYYRKLTIF